MKKHFDWMVAMYDWFNMFFWQVGWMALHFLKGDFNGGVEMTYWIRVHLTYNGKCVEKPKIPFWKKVRNTAVSLFGVFICASLLYGISRVVISMLN